MSLLLLFCMSDPRFRKSEEEMGISLHGLVSGSVSNRFIT